VSGSTSSVVVTVARFWPGPYGGGIASGHDERGAAWRVSVPHGSAARDPEPGERWRFTGQPRSYARDHLRLSAAAAWPLAPRGHALVEYLATNPRFVGVGRACARRLWDQFGEPLYDILQRRESDALAAVVGPFLAASIVLGWGLYVDEVETLAWLDRHGVAPRTAARALALWGAGARQRLCADPYALCLLESWAHVDQAAQRAGLLPDDERRLTAAVEEACARRFGKKHTAFTREELRRELHTLLDQPSRIDRALELAQAAGQLIEIEPGHLQARGPHEMERLVAVELERRCARPVGAPFSAALAEVLDGLEADAGIVLTELQRHAVKMAVTHDASVLCGGAGTGKTTVLRAVLAAVQATHGEACPVHQAALSGRAAKRMAEATGAPALTVYRLLMGLRRGEIPPDGGLLILDEASMLDLPIMYSILRALGPTKRLLLVGDPAQLPPIGPGLVFHRLVGSPRIPQVELATIHRQASDTGIPTAGAMIRHGRCPRLARFDFAAPCAPGVFLARATTTDIASTTLQVVEALAGRELAEGARQRDIQVLCAVRKGPAGSEALNEAIEAHHRGRDAQTSWGLQLGSKVVWLVNDHHRGTREHPQSLLNGALGFVTEVADSWLMADFDDGSTHRLTRSDLVKFGRGWAISIHKAQGSAFRHVVVPIVSSALLDRALVYTAVTRATHSVVLIGDEALLHAAVAREPTASMRSVGLQFNQVGGTARSRHG
jgi:exodeoxyribonuclease V alpha subunit